MKILNPVACIALTLATLTGCQRMQESATEATATVATTVSESVDKAMIEARRELATGNFTLDGNGLNLPSAQITPQGELVVDGKTIATTPEQKKMLLDYRTHITAIAEAGMEAGTQGVALAGTALTQAAGAIFSGKPADEVKKSVAREAGKVATAAQKICERLPVLLATQQKLAEALPAFKPYATMDQKDLANCRIDATDNRADIEVTGQNSGASHEPANPATH